VVSLRVYSARAVWEARGGKWNARSARDDAINAAATSLAGGGGLCRGSSFKSASVRLVRFQRALATRALPCFSWTWGKSRTDDRASLLLQTSVGDFPERGRLPVGGHAEEVLLARVALSYARLGSKFSSLASSGEQVKNRIHACLHACELASKLASSRVRVSPQGRQRRAPQCSQTLSLATQGSCKLSTQFLPAHAWRFGFSFFFVIGSKYPRDMRAAQIWLSDR